MNNKYKWKYSCLPLSDRRRRPRRSRNSTTEHARVCIRSRTVHRARMHARDHAMFLARASLLRAVLLFHRCCVCPALLCYTYDRESARPRRVAFRLFFFSHICARIVCQSASRSLFRLLPKTSTVSTRALAHATGKILRDITIFSSVRRAAPRAVRPGRDFVEPLHILDSAVLISEL